MENIRILIVLLLMFTFNIGSYSQQLKNGWNYPVKPGTEDWNNLKTEDERIAAMQIPFEILENMSSEELAFTCANFPLFGYYTAFDTPQDGIDIMFYRFNLFRFACKKKETISILVDLYKDAGIEGWNKNKTLINNDYWTLKYNYLEYLIAQKDLLTNLDDKTKNDLIEIAKGKISEKLKSDSFNSISGISSSYYLIAHILNSKGLLVASDASDNFLKSGMIINFQLIEDIEESYQQFLKNN